MNIHSLSRVQLGFMPTPVHTLDRLSQMLGGPQILMKRDDQTGLALGGNKTRKLEYILADALEQQCDTIVTAGAIQSNHCRQTAAAAAKLGLECHLVLGGSEPELANGNLLLDRLLGAHIHWAGNNRKGEDLPRIMAELEGQGKKPYLVPYGGSNQWGAAAFANAVVELQQQQNLNDISHVIFSSSSGGTHAGLMVGKAITQGQFDVLGINNDKTEGEAGPFNQHIATLANQCSSLLNAGQSYSAAEVNLNIDYVGEGYGIIGEAEKQAISLLARSEGILLDPVYTAKAMAGLLDLIANNKLTSEDRVLFWHTGGAPALFAYADKLSDMV